MSFDGIDDVQRRGLAAIGKSTELYAEMGRVALEYAEAVDGQQPAHAVKAWHMLLLDVARAYRKAAQEKVDAMNAIDERAR